MADAGILPDECRSNIRFPFPGFRIGDFTTYSKEEETGNIIATQRSIHPAKVVKDKLNYAATLRAAYNVTGQFGLTADGTVATRFPRINEYAGTGPTEEQYKRVTIPLIRGGLFYKNKWINLTSMVTYISKSNNIDQQNLTKPGTEEGKTVLLIYNIKTLGWTTSAEIDPFKGFHLHALFTYQKPVYKNYNASVTFNDGSEMSVNANGMIVKEIPQILVELDPSYNITKDLRLWLSFRYFGKTYANLQEASISTVAGKLSGDQLECKQASFFRGNSHQLPESEGGQRNHQRFGTDYQRRSCPVCRQLYEWKLFTPIYRRI